MRTSVRRVWGVALTLALLGAQLGGYVHAVTAEHAICAEHGEVIELAEGADPARHHPVTARDALTSAAPWADPDQHAHCDVLVDRRERAAVPPAQAGLEFPAPGLVARVQAAVPAAQAIPLLRLAPKSSPPA